MAATPGVGQQAYLSPAWSLVAVLASITHPCSMTPRPCSRPGYRPGDSVPQARP
jgi:hypothetical protein